MNENTYAYVLIKGITDKNCRRNFYYMYIYNVVNKNVNHILFINFTMFLIKIELPRADFSKKNFITQDILKN